MAPVVYNCRYCNALFEGASARADVNAHHKTEWHTLNMRKSLAGLDTLDYKSWRELKDRQNHLQKELLVSKNYHCKDCKKYFLSQGSMDTHMKSKKHKQAKLRTIVRNRTMLQKQNKSFEDADNAIIQNPITCDFCPGQNNKYKVFLCEKDYKRHISTASHKERVRVREIEDKRRQNLDNADVESSVIKTPMLTDGTEGGQVEEEDDDDYEDIDDDAIVDDMEEVSEEGEDQVMDVETPGEIPPTSCLFCDKNFGCIEDNLGHMLRQHEFKIPHEDAADMTRFLKYLGHKVGVEHNCIDCDKSFDNMKAARNHMLMKRHFEIRFEGEYDEFFDVAKICNKLQKLPVHAGAENLMFLPLPDGKLLTHRDLQTYFKQRLGQQKSLKRLRAAGSQRAIGFMGKQDGNKTMQEQRNMDKKQLRSENILTKLHFKKSLNMQRKANKLQPHFRLQYGNAG